MPGIEQRLAADADLSRLANANIGWAAQGCPAIILDTFESAPAYKVPDHAPSFIRVSCVSASFSSAMTMARRVRAVLDAIPMTFVTGGSSHDEGHAHTIITDFEVWTTSE